MQFFQGFSQQSDAFYSIFHIKRGVAVPFFYSKGDAGEECTFYMDSTSDFNITEQQIRLRKSTVEPIKVYKKTDFLIASCELGFQIIFGTNYEAAWEHMKHNTMPTEYYRHADRIIQKNLLFAGHMLLSHDQYRRLVELHGLNKIHMPLRR